MSGLNIARAKTDGVHWRGDDLANTLYRSWDDLFSWDAEEVAKFQIKALQQRFDELLPKVKALRTRADMYKVSGITDLNDVIPLLFDHAAYKSYPMALLEKGQFRMLTKWLDGMTSLDLSGIDTSGCTTIDGWLDKLEANSDLRVFHTSATSGKVSFIPRTNLERDLWNDSLAKIFAGFRNDGGTKLGGTDGERLPVIFLNPAKGRYTAQHMAHFFAHHVAPTPEDCHALPGVHSADLVSLSGRIRVAQSKGELGKMTISDELRASLRDYLTYLQERPRIVADFIMKMADELRGQRVMMVSTAGVLFSAANEAAGRGYSHCFRADSLGLSGGGGKDVSLPENWQKIVDDFTGFNEWRLSYAMTEQTAVLPRCAYGHYHIPPYSIPFLLDPESGAPLPREGVRTGRFAAFDIIAQTLWGGIVSGDRVTIDWNGGCGCGRKGAFAHDDIVRYDSIVTGDDKITCSATIDNSDTALDALLGR